MKAAEIEKKRGRFKKYAADGLNAAQVSEAENLSKRQVRDFVKNNNLPKLAAMRRGAGSIPSGGPANKFKDIDGLRRCLDAGMSAADAVKELGFSEFTLKKYAKEVLGRRFPRAQFIQRRIVGNPQNRTTKIVNYIPRGKALNLKHGSAFLHMGGEKLTQNRHDAWRGSATQAKAMMSKSPFEGLTEVIEQK